MGRVSSRHHEPHLSLLGRFEVAQLKVEVLRLELSLRPLNSPLEIFQHAWLCIKR